MNTVKSLSPVCRRLSVVAFLVALFGALPTVAQFNGPGLPATTPNNVPTTVTTDRRLLFPSSRDVQLGAGDIITVKVFGPGDYLATARIGIDGQVQLPLVGVVSLQNLSVTQAETLIAQKLVEAEMFRNPEVLITVTEGPRSSVSIIGEMHGVIPIVGERRLLDILAAAGSMPNSASHVITINRPGVPNPIVVDLGTDPATSELANVPVFGGDTIVVSRVGVVYLLGAWGHQGVVPIAGNTPLTLMQVASIGGGPNYVGSFSDMRIIRTVGTQRTLVKIDMKKVMYGKVPDPILQADDIVFLPTSTMKAIIQSGGVGALFGIVSLLVALR